jgi:ATP-dependent RNA helicase DDX19/DBP5
MLTQIGTYFNSPMLRVETTDWDAVEEVIKKVIKSSAAQPDFQPQRA